MEDRRRDESKTNASAASIIPTTRRGPTDPKCAADSSSNISSPKQQQRRTGAGALAGSHSFGKEAVFGLISGVAFGAISPIIGHPFDTVKTRMQAEAQFQSMTAWQTAKHIYQREGVIRGLYRGFWPPLVGSMAFRGILFSAYSGTFAACQEYKALSEPIPFTGGLRLSVVLGAVAASVARASIESPFDYVKVRFMVGQSPLQNSSGAPRSITQTARALTSQPVTQTVRHLYRGFGATLGRTLGLLGSFFILVDYSVRYIPDVVNAPLLGPFFKGGICATAAWVVAFPLEVTKSVIQGGGTADNNNNKQQLSTWRVLYRLYQERGVVRGWYRGFLPGASRSFVANGASMIVYSWFQEHIRASAAAS